MRGYQALVNPESSGGYHPKDQHHDLSGIIPGIKEIVLNYIGAIGMLLLTVYYISLCLSRLVCLTLFTTGSVFRLVLDSGFP